MSQHENRRQFWHAHFQHCRELGMARKAYADQERRHVRLECVESGHAGSNTAS